MQSFISGVLKQIAQTNTSFSDTIFILPSKRAGSYLLKELQEQSTTTIFAPEILSIEEFTEEVSDLKTVDNTISIFEFYQVYKSLTLTKETESFDTFLNWAQTIIHDFNEVDRYLLEPDSFFDYLSRIQDINHWALQPEKTLLVKNYLKFWRKLPEYYHGLKDTLLKEGKAYQGLVYRKAAESIQEYTKKTNKKHVFIGFNALNKAEKHILQYLLESEKADIYWDLDETFLNDSNHGASLFLRDYLKNWKFYKENPYVNTVKVFNKEKKIDLIGVPKNIGQAKYIGNLLASLEKQKLENTAIVLGEEELLLPMLSSMPEDLKELNITMGFPIKNIPLYSLFDAVFNLHLNQNEQFYYKDVISILVHPVFSKLLDQSANTLIEKIKTENLIYLAFSDIKKGFPEKDLRLVEIIFETKLNDPNKFLQDIQDFTQIFKKHLKEQDETLELEFLYHFYTLFNKLQNLLSEYSHIENIKSLYNFYKELAHTETLDFQGKPFKGLQLMGMLESRALDFDTVIITSLNEGTLPAGKSDNSFIPYDLKKEFELPTYKEKDAVYTYHFYRLLQRAKQVYLLYNTEADGLNSGEKSRFITQLEIEKQPKHEIEKYVVSPKAKLKRQELKEVPKTEEIMDKIKSLALSGFSPSALSTYIRNPLDFYYRYVLGIKDEDEVEETIAFNTLGTIVHNVLEAFYKPLEGRDLKKTDLNSFLEQIPEKTSLEFQRSYGKTNVNKGKNLLIFEVAKRYLYNFLQQELQRLEKNEEVKITMIEQKVKHEIKVEILNFPVYLSGKIDRVEEANGVTRIIDYKTGKAESRNLKINDWESLTTDYDNYGKSFQVLTYAYLLAHSKGLKFPVEAGIISFKNLKSGFLKFTDKSQGKPESLINNETLQNFEAALKNLILEICNIEVPFRKKEIKSTYGSF